MKGIRKKETERPREPKERRLADAWVGCRHWLPDRRDEKCVGPEPHQHEEQG